MEHGNRTEEPLIKSTTLTDRRLPELDAARGLIMMLMALDHTMELVCRKGFFEFWAMCVPDYGSLQAFFTRFITHTCAPGFALIMGAGMVFFATSRRSVGWEESRIIRHYWIRALVLVVIMLTLENFVWQQAFPSRPDSPVVSLEFGVLFSLAGSMALGSFLLKAPDGALAGIGLTLALTTQWIITSRLGSPEPMSGVSLPLMFSFVPSGIRTPTLGIFVLYPVLPWFVFTLFGMILARRIQADRPGTGKVLPLAGSALIAAFVLLRTTGGFGNTHPVKGSGIMAFLALNKYPPSLAYMLLFSGVNLLIISSFSRAGLFWARKDNPLQVFGKCPFFFYILHLFFFLAVGKLFPAPPGYWGGYACWATGLSALYWPCRAFVKLKARSSPDSIIRLF
ncbi:MAG TPA: heparan-alpha-glucosaminide N-acetyltransferase domain-containing protein [Synergistales bacterium]|nr:heparan-alpha-glucosaminide N-acetyltransferase domain-containing protein [Synergistales bacterium]